MISILYKCTVVCECVFTGISMFTVCLTLLRGALVQTGSSAAKAMLLIAMTTRMDISK